MIRRIALLLILLWSSGPGESRAETSHQIFFKGTDSELDVYTIKGQEPGPTMLLLGGIQGDEPGGYLAADLYADISLRKGNVIVIPRANFFSIVENSRGSLGDMNRKFATKPGAQDRDGAVVELIKEFMTKSDLFLNLHDGSGFYYPKWESPERNPLKFGQSVIIDADEFTLPGGKTLKMAPAVNRVLEKVNARMPVAAHQFRLNNHRTLSSDTKHKEQRLSATYHALTKVGIPAFGIETSKSISDYRVRVRYQTMVVNAFLEEFGIILDNPKMYLENPYLKYLIVSVNGRTPIVVGPTDVLRVHEGDEVRIVHIESNYSRGLTARIRGLGKRFNDLNQDVRITENTTIIVRKDRFLVGSIPVEVTAEVADNATGIHFEPTVKYFRVRVNGKTFTVEPGEELTVVKGDTVVVLDPRTNLNTELEKSVKVDLRGFQVENSPYPLDDRGHHIQTSSDLQEKYARRRGSLLLYSLQAKLNNKVFGESALVIAEPKLEYVILKDGKGSPIIAYPEDKIEFPEDAVIGIVDVRSNVPDPAVFLITMSGKSIRWQPSEFAGIDGALLSESETPLDIVRSGKSIGRIWLKKGRELRVSSGPNRNTVTPATVRY